MPSPSAPAPLATLRHHRWVRRGLWALLALLLLWLVSWLAVPALAKGPLERMASEALGRPVTVGAIDFKPWTLEVTLRDIAVGGTKGAPPQLEIARIYADAEMQSLLRLAPVVDALEIDAPHLRLTHLADGHYDVDDILDRLSAPSGKPDTGPMRLALYKPRADRRRGRFHRPHGGPYPRRAPAGPQGSIHQHPAIAARGEGGAPPVRSPSAIAGSTRRYRARPSPKSARAKPR